jgi:hypothetical protein
MLVTLPTWMPPIVTGLPGWSAAACRKFAV